MKSRELRRQRVELEAARAALQQTQAELQRALAMRDEFMSMVSHELRTPLSVMTLDVAVRKEKLAKGKLDWFSPERLQAMVARDDRQLRSMTRLIDDMLDISRIRHGKLSLRTRRTDLGELARHVVADFGVHYRNVPLNVEAAEGVVGDWDDSRISQVLVNLLSNALRYGGGKPVQVEVGRTPDGLALLAVSDQGPGIAAADQQRVFEQFERGVDAQGPAGLGLGLFISRHFVEAHGGSLAVQSEPGAGARFEVRLPAS